ncbi:MAG: hypothetical protein ABI623_11820 [bacterium]
MSKQPKSLNRNEETVSCNRSLAVIGFVLYAKLSSANSKGHKVLIHVISNIKKDDGPPCVAFDIAYANLVMGNRVEMLFDSEAAWNLKRTEADGKSDFNRYEVPADLKRLLVAQAAESYYR